MKKNLLLISLTTLILAGCGDAGGSTPTQPSKNNFSNITMNNLTIDYDGEEHTITATGVPDFATVTYTNEGPYTLPGTYNIGASISADDYNDLNLNATLKINALNFTGITFEDDSLTYDGEEHTITATGVPDFATVTYTNNGPFTEADTYEIGAKVSATGYNDLTLTATLEILPLNFSDNLKFEDKTFEYDGNPHSIVVEGSLPANATVTYTSNVDGVTNSATNKGIYTITATITAPNFATKTLTAILTIKTNEIKRSIVATNGNVYFANAMDDNKLYSYKEGAIKKVSYDKMTQPVLLGNDDFMYVSSSLLSSAIKHVSGSKAIETIFTENVDYFAVKNSTEIFYSINGLTNDKSGIYKVDLSGDEPVTTLLSVGKAKYLTFYNSKLYFADGSNSDHLSYINTSVATPSRVQVIDDKINNLYLYNGSLYYTVNRLLGDYIERYIISSSSRVKLTSDAGEEFTFVGNDLYYLNVDMLNGESGIYKVSNNKTSDSNASGTGIIHNKTIDITNLTSDGNKLVYYDCTNNYKIMVYDISSKQSFDILEGFTKPADPAPFNRGGQIDDYNNVIYYLDIYDEKTLHTYNPSNGQNNKLTSNKVANFLIHNDKLYINMVTNLVNNDLYVIDLITASDPVKISSLDATQLVADDSYLYFVENDGAGVAKKVHRLSLTNYEDDLVIFDKGVSDLTLFEGDLYFYRKATLYNYLYKISDPELLTAAADPDEIVKATEVFSNGEELFVIASDKLCIFDTSSEQTTKIFDDGNKINYFFVDGDYLYYYYNTDKAATEGLYKMDLKTGTYESTLILLCDSTYYCSSIHVYNGLIYFVNHQGVAPVEFGNSHVYSISVNGGEPTLVA